MLFRFLGIVLHKFFFLQYFEKIHIYKIPVKSVDHELDTKVPFREELTMLYLDFINYWIRPLSMMIKKFGHRKGVGLSVEYLNRIVTTYNEAYKVYSRNLTTTVRPKPQTKAVKNIQRVDPHYCCVPSLHIAIIVLTISFYKMLLNREDFSEDERKNWYDEIYSHGIKISESVLYMKQHSVNCIPAAIFMMTVTFPDIMNRELAEKMICDLFKNEDDVAEENKNEIRRYIQNFYNRMMDECAIPEQWSQVVLDWLRTYVPYDPKY
ncbi:hypothetical protein [Treponema sp.]|uniref:hypothetical protein n=1 Tax=Treponema sp. TaxID=166 RepID=UPI00298D91E1|nr:hypothetical protein [Treponema sp.]